MKHTPGKWIFEKQTSGYEHIKHPIIVMTEQEEGGAMIAAIYDFGAMEETKANANLIAAAPDMLEALKRAKRGIEKLMQDYQNNSAFNQLTVKMIDEAIEKTEPK